MSKELTASDARRVRPIVALVATLALMFGALIPQPPDTEAQGSTNAEQDQAAERLMAQLDAQSGPVDVKDLDIDPALGPPPWTSFTHDRSPASIEAWKELAARVSQPKFDPDVAARLAVDITDIEQPEETGLNDSPDAGQSIPGFGSGADDTATIVGSLAGGGVESVCESSENDGAIEELNGDAVANIADAGSGVIDCYGVIGDGPHADTTGDIDMFEIGFVPAGWTIIADALSPLEESFEIEIYDSAGNSIARANDPDEADFLFPVAPADDVYFAAIAGRDGLGDAADRAFDSTSGNGPTTEGPYILFVGLLATPEEPEPPTDICFSLEGGEEVPQSDDSIPEANPLPGVPITCIGTLSDGVNAGTTGDFDFFAVDVELPGSIIVANLSQLEAAEALRLTVFDSDGNEVASLDDTAVDDEYIMVGVETAGAYFVAVSVAGVAPDPFDPSTGQGQRSEAVYGLFIDTFDLVCESPEAGGIEDGSISDANLQPGSISVVSQVERYFAVCYGIIGDGAYGDRSGDFDVFEVIVGGDDLGEIVIDLSPFDRDVVVAIPPSIRLYAADGTEVGLVPNPDDTLLAVVPPGAYYVALGEPGASLADPFDPASGPGGGEVGFTYEVLIGADYSTGPPVEVAQDSLAKYKSYRDQVEATEAARIEAVEDELAAFGPPCTSVEEDGSLADSNEAELTVDGDARICFGFVGDGAYGDSSGDFDMFGFSADVDDFVEIEVNASRIGSPLDPYIWVLSADGTIVGFNDDANSSLDSALDLSIPATGDYYLVVGSYASFFADPTDPSAGTGAATTGQYSVTMQRLSEPPVFDTDFYLVELAAGDVLRAAFDSGEAAVIVDPAGTLRAGSDVSAAIVYPQASPINHGLRIGTEHIADVSGTYAIGVFGNTGSYTGELKVVRPALTDRAGQDQQIIFLDFDGASVDVSVFEPFADQPDLRNLSGLESFLADWGFGPADLDPLIDAIIASVEENVSHDLRMTGGNGDRDASGTPGEFDVQILNSRDHADPWGAPNVTRLVIGGTIEESGIDTIGIAQSIDPGNFDTEETGLVLLDALSDPGGGSASLNQFPIADGASKIEMVGTGVGVITAHEIGHMIGNWHTRVGNARVGIMDRGGDMAGVVGVGADGVWGSADDQDTDFHEDEYEPSEGFFGIEDTRIRSGFALSTGQTAPDPEPTGPEPGIYTLFNVDSERWLDADPGRQVDTSSSPSADDRWELIPADGDGGWYIRNVLYGYYLDTDSRTEVDMSTSPRADDVWLIYPAEGAVEGAFIIEADQRGDNLTVRNRDVHRLPGTGEAAQWLLFGEDDGGGGGPEGLPHVGDLIALRNGETDRWLDADRREVNQSTTRRDDDVWMVVDAGDPNGIIIGLRNQVTNRYLDGDGASRDYNVDSSSSLRADDRWEMVRVDGGIALRNVALDRWLWAESGGAYNVETRAEQSQATVWIVEPIS